MKRKGGWFNPILTTIASGVHKLVRAHQQRHARNRRGGRKKTIKKGGIYRVKTGRSTSLMNGPICPTRDGRIPCEIVSAGRF